MKVDKRVVFKVNYNDLDDAVEKAFQLKGYESVAYQEWGNGESHSFQVTPELLGMDDIKDIRANPHWKLGRMLDHMCVLGIIEEGEYVVEVSW